MTHPTIERLKQGQGLCPECGEFSKHHWGDDTCGNNCRHDTMMNTSSLKVITLSNLVTRLPELGNEHYDFVATQHPEIITLQEQMEAEEDRALYASRNKQPQDDLGQSLFEMMSAIGFAQVMQQEIEQ
jgi:hypothetical protein